MGLSLETSVPVLTVFLQGLLSFFSPCVLPLVPLYVSYLAGGARDVDSDGNIRYPRGRVLVNTLFFVVGISFTFFLLGFGFTALGSFFRSNQTWFARISGIIMILFGLYQFGVFGRSGALEREHRLPFRLDRWAMNPLVALVLGFTFSFAWTPCVGPALTSVLLMASSASSSAVGYALIGVYTLGFVIPFLAVGLFTGAVLDFFKRHQRVVKYTVKTGGVLMILMGIMMLTGWMNGITGYLSSFGGAAGGESVSSSAGQEPGTSSSPASENESSSPQASSSDASQSLPSAPDFTFYDQNGQQHTLSDYKGKVVFLNFWATWCPPCQNEMPDIQQLYEDYGLNQEDLVVLGVANPRSEENPYNQDVSEEEVEAFLTERGYTYPVVMDTTGEVFQGYGVTSFPTTFMIDRDGNVFGYITGMLTRSMMDSIIEQTMSGERTPVQE